SHTHGFINVSTQFFTILDGLSGGVFTEHVLDHVQGLALQQTGFQRFQRTVFGVQLGHIGFRYAVRYRGHHGGRLLVKTVRLKLHANRVIAYRNLSYRIKERDLKVQTWVSHADQFTVTQHHATFTLVYLQERAHGGNDQDQENNHSSPKETQSLGVVGSATFWLCFSSQFRKWIFISAHHGFLYVADASGLLIDDVPPSVAVCLWQSGRPAQRPPTKSR